MRIESEKKDGNLNLKLYGRLETVTAPQLQKTLEQELETVTMLQLDMEQLEYVSSAGLRVLLMASKKMKAKEGSMQLIHVNEDIMEIFEITGFNEFLDIR